MMLEVGDKDKEDRERYLEDGGVRGHTVLAQCNTPANRKLILKTFQTIPSTEQIEYYIILGEYDVT